MLNKFFVYGTLKVGGYFAGQFDEKRVSSQKALINGFNLYDLMYPAVVKGDNVVHGELHTFNSEDVKEVLQGFDMIEGFNEKDRRGSLYLREVIAVVMENGKIEEAYAYLFNDNLTHYKDKIVESGIYELP